MATGIISKVTEEDISAVVEGYSFARIQWLLLFLAAGMTLLGYLVLRLYQLQSQEGTALMEDIPWLLPALTVFHAVAAFIVVAREKHFEVLHWQGETIDPRYVAHLGWRSAPRRTPTEVCILLIEATITLRLAAYAALALLGLGILWVGITTSDLLKTPFYWINAVSYGYWWILWIRSFLTKSRALQVFSKFAAGSESGIHVISENAL